MIIDVHAHLDQYTENLDTVLDEIKQHQIITVSNSLDLDSYQLNCEVANRSKLVIPVFGVHPIYASKYAGDLGQMDEALESSPFFGEVGLDFKLVKETSQLNEQKIVFEYLLESAVNQNKYVIVHSKDTDEEVLTLIEKHNVQKVIMHWFTGTQEVFQKLVDRGAFFTVGADVMHSPKVQQMSKKIPAHQLLTETDNPLVSLNLPNTLAMPRVLNDIVKELARQRGTTAEDIVQTVERNFMAIIQSIPSLAKYSKKIARDIKNRRGSRLR
ncbi:MAG: TatD family hydrolase [Proteobacteria bacterium]|nr:TatD family hydrolase [Pseudomonadota bacterium]